MKTITEEAIRSLAEDILSDIDYDLYKEDLIDGLGMVDDIEYKLTQLVLNLDVVILTVE